MKDSGVDKRCSQVHVKVETNRFLRTLWRRGLRFAWASHRPGNGGLAGNSSAAFRQHGSKDTLLLSSNTWSHQRKTLRRQLHLRKILLSCGRRLPMQDAHCVHLGVQVYWVSNFSRRHWSVWWNVNKQGRYFHCHLLFGIPLWSIAAFQLSSWMLPTRTFVQIDGYY